jgi:hypothetical protein
MAALDLIVEYVEGRRSSEEFQEYLRSDKALENILSEDGRIPPYTKDGTLYIYLMQNDLQSTLVRLNSQDALRKFLDIKGVSYRRNDAPKKIFAILLKAQPKWLDIPDFYLKEVLPHHFGEKPKEIISYAKRKINERFTFLNKPPEWLQSPQWMFKNGNPLKFIGQIDIGGLRHDNAQLYIFYDDSSKEFFTLEQSA